MREELDRLTLKNQELEKTNQQLESRWMVENMSFDQNKANSRWNFEIIVIKIVLIKTFLMSFHLIKFIIFRTRIPTLDSNLDELDDLEESRVDDVS